MAATSYSWQVERGSTLRFSVVVTQPDPDSTLPLALRPRVPLDLTGYDARLVIFDYPDNLPLYAALASDASGDLLIDPTAARISVRVRAATTRSWDFERVQYALQLIDPDGEPVPLLAAEGFVNPAEVAA